MNVIKKELSINVIRCWLPAFLPYVDEEGVIKYNTHELPNGAWGKIIPNIIIPDDISITYLDTTFNGGDSISYRELMSLYYSIIRNNDTEAYDRYISFIEEINSIYSTEGLNLSEKCLDVPQKFFLIEKDKHIEELQTIKDSIELLEVGDKTKFSKTEKLRFIELTIEYKRKGGDKFLEYLRSLPSFEEETIRLSKYVDVNNQPRICFDVFFGYKMNDLGYSTPLNNKWTPGVKYFAGDIVQYGLDSYICTCEDDTYTIGVYNSETGRIEFDYENFTLIKEIDGLITPTSMFGNIHTDNNISFDVINRKRLKELRTHTCYRNVIDEVEDPIYKDEDWLYYYRKGIIRSTYTRDDDNNIEHYGFDKTNGNDLVVYGSGISNISFDKDNMHLVVEYFIDSHLIADFLWTEKDEFDREIYVYDNFRLDKSTEYSEVSNGGIYTERFRINEGGSLHKLIEGTLGVPYTFEDYISNPNVVDDYKYEFYEFSDSVLTQTKHIKTNKTDYQYDYMIKQPDNIGLTFDNGLDDLTDFSRGETKYFESHIKFSEIRNIDELTMYSNGGFYQIEDV